MKTIEELNQEVLKERLCEDDESKIKAYLHLKHHNIEMCQSNLEEAQSEVELCEHLTSEAINDYNKTLNLEASEIVALYEL